MEVTKSNFEVVLPRVVDVLGRAEFYTVDFEMSGIRTADDKPNLLGTAAEAFVEKNKAAQRYTILQFGLCAFVRKPSASSSSPPRYEAYPFNFFTFPGSGDEDVKINVDTAGFLAKHGMDFSKWITQGVRYVKVVDAAKMRDEVRAKLNVDEDGDGEATGADSAAAASDGPTPTTSSPKRTMRNEWDQLMIAKVEKADSPQFSTAMAEAARYQERVRVAQESNGDIPEPEPAAIPPFKDKSTIGIFTKFLSSLGLTRFGKRGTKGMTYFMLSQRAKDANDMRDVEEAIGMTRLYEAMVACKKPIIVHNGLMDLLFMHHCFDGAPVADLPHFKTMLRDRFPTIFDTRYLATHPKVPFDPKVVQNLEGQYNAFHQQHGQSVLFTLPFGFESYDPAVLQSSSRAHEAAYDALITGRLLLYMARVLGDGSIGSLQAQGFSNKVPVYGCLQIIQILEESDSIDHEGPVIEFTFPRSSGMSSTRIDEMLKKNDLRGRVLWNGDRAFVFSPASARGVLFDKSVGQARKAIMDATSKKGAVNILVP